MILPSPLRIAALFSDALRSLGDVCPTHAATLVQGSDPPPPARPPVVFSSPTAICVSNHLLAALLIPHQTP